MICPNCGKVIANDSIYCEFCGAKVEVNKPANRKKLWIILGTLLGVAVLALILVLVLGRGSSKPVTYFPSDLSVMNIQGDDIIAIKEQSYYGTDWWDNLSYAEDSHGGFFDGAAFLANVYSDEHIARIFYQKWFLSQVSDCEMSFDKYGYITSIKSIWPEGGDIRYTYDDNLRVIKTDARSNTGNQDEGVITHNYVEENGLVTVETLSQETEWGTYEYTIRYKYDKDNRLVKATFGDGKYECFFDYKDEKLHGIYIQDYWGEGKPLSIDIQYNEYGDIARVISTGKKGREETARETVFLYQYNSRGNWIRRNAYICYASGEKYSVETDRNYWYKGESDYTSRYDEGWIMDNSVGENIEDMLQTYPIQAQTEASEIEAAAEEMWEEEEEPIFVVADVMPQFPGGEQAMFRFLAGNVKYPVAAQENHSEGKVYVQFVVEKDGSLTDVNVVSSPGDPSLDKEAMRVVKAMPNWIPGQVNGYNVRVRFTIPVSFKLQ